jgi:hypothetical protein
MEELGVNPLSVGLEEGDINGMDTHLHPLLGNPQPVRVFFSNTHSVETLHTLKVEMDFQSLLKEHILFPHNMNPCC